MACSDRGIAADLCASYVLNGVRGWFLPSRDELALLYRNLKATGAGDFRDHGMIDNCEYWTSSQPTADMADHIDSPTTADFTTTTRISRDESEPSVRFNQLARDQGPFVCT